MIKKLYSFAYLITAGLLALNFSACDSKPVTDFYYLVATQVQQNPQTKLTVTFLRKFEKENWCKDEAKRFAKMGFTANCPYNARMHDSTLAGEKTGKWYLLHRIGKFPPSAIVFEYEPPIPDEIVLAQLKRIAPHAVKLAALSQSPAEAVIFSPAGDVRFQETIMPGAVSSAAQLPKTPPSGPEKK